MFVMKFFEHAFEKGVCTYYNDRTNMQKRMSIYTNCLPKRKNAKNDKACIIKTLSARERTPLAFFFFRISAKKNHYRRHQR